MYIYKMHTSQGES